MGLTKAQLWTCLALLCLCGTNAGRQQRSAMEIPHGQQEDVRQTPCAMPQPPMNGMVSCMTDWDGTEVCTASCADGYNLASDNADITCNMDGTWSGAFPECVATVQICQLPAPPMFGHVSSATDVNGKQTATPSCMSGYHPETPFLAEYVCVNGAWSPTATFPNCVKDGADGGDVILPVLPGSTESSIMQVDTAVVTADQFGHCTAFGQSHYRTFDGQMYYFRGSCTYLLAGDCADNTFKIHVRNQRDCSAAAPCHRFVTIYLGNMVIRIEKGASGPVVFHNDLQLTIPTKIGDGLLVEKVATYITVKSGLGFQLKWDGDEAIFVDVTDELSGKTCGLCGKFNRDPSDDFTDIMGHVAHTPTAFANSYKMLADGETCHDSTSQNSHCKSDTTQHQQVTAAADATCRSLLDSPTFATCRQVVDAQPFYQACMDDVCFCNGQRSGCECGTFEAFARECMRQNIHFTWRTNSFCPVSCPAGQVYQDCGSSCPKTCRQTVYNCEDEQCIDGCHCPDGYFLHGNDCLLQDQCPCLSHGQEYLPGSTIKSDCNDCECKSGRWECTNNVCESTCRATGDPHYMTFDGKRYDFMGDCSYTLARNIDNSVADFHIVAENIECGTSSARFASCTKSISVMHGGSQLKMKQNLALLLNGQDITRLPHRAPGLYIEWASSIFQKVTLDNGMSILWDGNMRAYITSPASFSGKTVGLCGTFDNNQNNDFLTALGDIETNPVSFANKWKTDDTCMDQALMPGTEEIAHPCDIYSQLKATAQAECGYLLQEPFTACHDVVDVNPFYQNCLFDFCASQTNTEQLCSTLSDYAMACASKGVVMDWRDVVPGCALNCMGDMIYQSCASSCGTSCASLAEGLTCQDDCVEGCNCPPGTVLDHSGYCVTPEQCGCMHNGLHYADGETINKDCNTCICHQSQFQCTQNVCPDAPLMASCGENEEFTTCKSLCPRTCDNMHLNVECTTVTCESGCQCKNDTVWDSTQQKCVTPNQCPCYHGSHSYQAGETIQMDCNTCYCNGQVWTCETKECPGICSVFGDPHYKTFDGKMFEFQGDCDYVISKTKDTYASPYSITAENIPCGTSGVTCTKNIVFTLGSGPTRQRLTLVRGQPITVTQGQDFRVRESGMFIFINTPIGVELQWDKGTRIYIRLEPHMKNQVEGLCGNFNDDQNDDFTSPSGGPASQLANEFGDSWKVHDYCMDAVVVEDTCALHPNRQSWAQRRCSIIKSEVFEPCHVHVPYQTYYDKCVYDACGCDSGGDCECLCTAIAAYHYECALHGIYILWREQEICPMQCDHGMQYVACANPCPMTCSNYAQYDQLYPSCNDTCVEGCGCPDGFVIGDDGQSCVRPEQCACLMIEGVSYDNGDQIPFMSDNCRTCYCENHQIKCIGQPCDGTLTTAKPEVTTGVFTTTVFTATSGVLTTSTDANVPIFSTTSTVTTKPTIITSTTPPPTQVCLTVNGVSYLEQSMIPDISNECQTCYCISHNIQCAYNPDCATTTQATSTGTPPIFTLPPGEITTGFQTPTATTGTLPIFTLPPGETTTGSTGTTLPPIQTTGVQTQTTGVQTQTVPPIVTSSTTGTVPLFTLPPGETTIGVETLPPIVTTGSTTGTTVPTFSTVGVTTEKPTQPVTIINGDTQTTTLPIGELPPQACREPTDHWTQWYSVSTPTALTGGDFETIDSIRQLYSFCPKTMLTAVECRTIGYNQAAHETGQVVTCDTQNGLICLNADQPMGKDCYNYEIRFFCECGPEVTTLPGIVTGTQFTTQSITTLPVVTVTTKPPSVTTVSSSVPTEPFMPGVDTVTPQITTTIPPECVRHGWTDWMNGDSPSTGEGDDETINSLRAYYPFCEAPMAIECRQVGTNIIYTSSQPEVVCDHNVGLNCMNNLNGGMCPDYEVRFYCDCSNHCDQPMNVADNGAIRDNMITASSERPDRPADDGRLDHPTSSWVPTVQDANQWIQVDLGEKVELTGIITQGQEVAVQPGFPEMPAWVTSYVVLYSTDGVNFFAVPDLHGNPQQFQGNYDSDSHVQHIFAEPIEAQYIRVQPLTWANFLSFRFELLGCRPFGNIPDGETQTTTPSPTPMEICPYGTQFWTPFMSAHHPDTAQTGVQETETYDLLSQAYNLCGKDMVDKIICRESATHMQAQTGGMVTCDLENGLVCNNAMQPDHDCVDYEVSFHCNCGGTGVTTINTPITTLATATTKPTTQVFTTQQANNPLCVDGWTPWISTNEPAPADDFMGGETESLALIASNPDYAALLCGGDMNMIADIQCREVASQADWQSTGALDLQCDTTNGFYCSNSLNYPVGCEDFEISVLCQCGEAPTGVITETTKPLTTQALTPTPTPTEVISHETTNLPQTTGVAGSTTITSDTTTGSTTLPVYNDDCPEGTIYWTPFYNSDTPTTGTDGGDHETYQSIVQAYGDELRICDEAMIDKVLCRHADSHLLTIMTNDEHVECDLQNGLVCLNSMQSDGMCENYEISFRCNCAPATTIATVGTTTTPIATTGVIGTVSPLTTLSHLTSTPQTTHGVMTETPGTETTTQQVIIDTTTTAPTYTDIITGETTTKPLMTTGSITETTASTTIGFETTKPPMSTGVVTSVSTTKPTMSTGIETTAQTPTTTSQTPTVVVEETTTKPLMTTGSITETTASTTIGIETTKPPMSTGVVTSVSTTKPTMSTGIETTASTTTTTLKPTTVQTTTKPENPAYCVDGWTPFMNSYSPDNIGDIETYSNLREIYEFCPVEMIDDIDCRVAGFNMDYALVGQNGVMCNENIGFICDSSQQDGTCMDYEIRVHCRCSEEPTTTTTPGTVIVSTTGQITLTGVVTEPQTEPTTIQVDTTTKPEETTTTKPVEETTPQTTTVSTLAPAYCPPGSSAWTPFMSADSPIDGNDIETIDALREKYSFCEDYMITNIVCRREGDHITADMTSQNVLCHPQMGLTCYSADNNGQNCYNFEVSFFCDCNLLTTTTPRPVTATQVLTTTKPITATQATTTTKPIMTTQATTTQATTATTKPTTIQTVSYPETETTTSVVGTTTTIGTVTGSETTTHAVEPTTSIGTISVPTSQTTTIAGTTKPTTIPTGTVPGTEGTTTTIGSVTTKPTTQTMQTAPQIACIQHGWSDWMNVDRPNNGNNAGDIESIDELRKYYTFCANPTSIKCREVGTNTQYDATGDGGNVCNLVTGFQCTNDFQWDAMCSDYEVSVYCDCQPVTTIQTLSTSQTFTTASQPPVVTTTQTQKPTTQQPTTVQQNPDLCVDGWTPWMSSDEPGNPTDTTEGDEETFPSLVAAGYNICGGNQNMVTSIECREIATGADWQSSGAFGMRCDLYNWFYCRNAFNYPVGCEDYEIRVYCQCSGTTTISTTTTKPLIETESTTTKPVVSTTIGIQTTPQTSPVTTTAGVSTFAPVCTDEMHGWTPWMNSFYPNPATGGDFETFDNLREQFAFCANEDIISIECRDSATGLPFDQTGQNGVKCDINSGLQCLNTQQFPIPACADYEIRVYCLCREETTVVTPIILTTTTAQVTTTKPVTTKPVTETSHFTTSQTTTTIGVVDTTTKPVTETSQFTTSQTSTTISVVDTTTKPVTTKPVTETSQFTTSQTTTTIGVEETSQHSPRKPVTQTSEFTTQGTTTTIGVVETTTKPVTATGVVTEPTPGTTTQVVVTEPTTLKPTTATATTTVPENPTTTKPITTAETTVVTGTTTIAGEVVTTTLPIGEVTTGTTTQQFTTTTKPGSTTKPVITTQVVTEPITGTTMTTSSQVFTTQSVPEETTTLEATTTKPITQTFATITTPAPTFAPQCLQDGYTPWFNLDKPNESPDDIGDIETLDQIREQFIFCDDDMITKVECQMTMGNGQGISSQNTGQLVTCDITNGLTCLNAANQPTGCYDYEIRFYCLCSGTTPLVETTTAQTTASQTTIGQTTTGQTTPKPVSTTTIGEVTSVETTPLTTAVTLPPLCLENVAYWTPYMNMDRPNTNNNGGDIETLEALRQYYSICPTEMIDDVECLEAATMSAPNQGSAVMCSPTLGLICLNSMVPNSDCEDYVVRFHCACGPETTTATQTTAQTTTKPEGTTTTIKPGTLTPTLETTTLHPVTTTFGEVTPTEEVVTFTTTTSGEPSTTIAVTSPTTTKPTPGVVTEQTTTTGFVTQTSVVTEKPTPTTTTGTTTTQTKPPTTPVQTTTPNNEPCREPMGLENGLIKPDQITASSHLDDQHRPEDVVLNNPTGAWRPVTNDQTQYLQVDLGELTHVTGFITQGEPETTNYVTTYYITFSTDGVNFVPYTDDGKVVTFPANTDSTTPVTNLLDLSRPITAQYIQIHPVTWNDNIALQAEILGCGVTPTTTVSSTETTPGTTVISTTLSTPVATTLGTTIQTTQMPSTILVTEPTGTTTTGVVTEPTGTTTIGVGETTKPTTLATVTQTQPETTTQTGTTKPTPTQTIQVTDTTGTTVTGVVTVTEPTGQTTTGVVTQTQVVTVTSSQPVTFTDVVTQTTKPEVITTTLATTKPTQTQTMVTDTTSGITTTGTVTAPVQTTTIGTTPTTKPQTTLVTGTTEGTTTTGFVTGTATTKPTPVTTLITGTTGTTTTGVVIDTTTIKPTEPQTTLVTGTTLGTTTTTAKPTTPVQTTTAAHNEPCTEPLGMEGGQIKPDQITASSQLDDQHSPDEGTLNGPSAWKPDDTDVNPSITVDLLEPTHVTGFITQGKPETNEFVTTYTVYYSNDGVNFVPYTDEFNKPVIFTANSDSTTPVTNLLDVSRPITAQYIQLRPTSWNEDIAMQVEVLGCKEPTTTTVGTTTKPITTQATTTTLGTTTPIIVVSTTGTTILTTTTTPVGPLPCQEPLGMESGEIKPDQITASSVYPDPIVSHGPEQAVLNNLPDMDGTGAWSPAPDDVNPYIQVDLGELVQVTGFITQGRPEYTPEQYVTEYTVYYSIDGINFIPYTDETNTPVVFNANTDTTTPVTNLVSISRPILAQYVQIHPQSYNEYPSMQLEILGLQSERANNNSAVHNHLWNTANQHWCGD
ncbi:PREDICTED: mucin-2-like isoform X2 [Branchiostoma belcheri]|uniref:Mucin-2-like isoform X2 n=1 Tax=Branchiostoma belcheri TaxID=7741 RepID=A0A6P4YXZ2_BRABE|nr:PREDICTED: mucin-2-like isoform X2 [Branchiostoma belcheri]